MSRVCQARADKIEAEAAYFLPPDFQQLFDY